MAISIFDLFKVGIGPSSSHTVGPMVAARRFLLSLDKANKLNHVDSISVEVYGSLALTGISHGIDKAIILGLSGEQPHLVDPDEVDNIIAQVKNKGELMSSSNKQIHFHPDKDLKFNRRNRLPHHTNGMKFTALDQDQNILAEDIFYSVGGGFVIEQSEIDNNAQLSNSESTSIPYAFKSARELLDLGFNTGMSITEIVLANEKATRSTPDIHEGINQLWQTMQNCIDRGCRADGVLPGRLKVERRAGKLYKQLSLRSERGLVEPLAVMDWVNLWAIAVNEENAAGGRVVTAPTNGAAGIIPAVLRYYDRYCQGANLQGIYNFLLTATAIGSLYKQNASISGAEVGCQGEVGVACSMAAAGLTAALGGSNKQVENAAEIGMEHNLGLTCDPIGGLVQIPCIERNAMGAIKAIDASRMAMLSDGTHKISLDLVIATMRQTGLDMQSKYKETSKGGLAANVVDIPVNQIEC